MKKYKLPEENCGVAEMEGEDEIDLPYCSSFAHNAEELEQAIMEAEAHWDDPNYWISEEEFYRRLYEKYPWLK